MERRRPLACLEMLRQEMEHRLSVWFRKTDQMLRRKIERRVKKTGVYSGQHRILMHLNLRPNCSQAELAEWMEISPAAIAVSIKKLEKAYPGSKLQLWMTVYRIMRRPILPPEDDTELRSSFPSMSMRWQRSMAC